MSFCSILGGNETEIVITMKLSIHPVLRSVKKTQFTACLLVQEINLCHIRKLCIQQYPPAGINPIFQYKWKQFPVSLPVIRAAVIH